MYVELIIILGLVNFFIINKKIIRNEIKQNILLLFLIAIFSITLNASEQIVQRNDYIVKNSFLLNEKDNGINGKVEILMDKALPTYAYNAEIDSDNFKKAKLVISNSDGKVMQSAPLKYPIANLEIFKYSNESFYKLNIDEYIGMGAYSGERTLLFEVKNGKILFQQYYDNTSKTNKNIILYRALRSSWRMFTKEKNLIFRQVYCKTNLSVDDVKFFTLYVAYVYDNKRWKRYDKEEPGFWDAVDHSFPDASKFKF